MSESGAGARRAKRSPLPVKIVRAAEPLDADVWATRYVAALLEREGVHVPADRAREP